MVNIDMILLNVCIKINISGIRNIVNNSKQIINKYKA